MGHQADAINQILNEPDLLSTSSQMLYHPEMGMVGTDQNIQYLWDAVHQPDPRSVKTLGDQAKHAPLVGGMAMFQVMRRLNSGILAITDIPIGAHPGRDADNHHNNHHLGKLSDKGIEAVFQSGGPDDGYVKLTRPMSIRVPALGKDCTKVIREGFQIPLEVGSIWGTTTVQHVGLECGLARWPQGHDFLTLLFVIDIPANLADLHHPSYGDEALDEGGEVLV